MSSKKLKSICEDYWLELLELSPELAIYRGFADKTNSMDMYDRVTYMRRKAMCDEIMERLTTLDGADDLSNCEKISHKLLKHYINTFTQGLVYGHFLMPISAFEGPEVSFAVRALPKLSFTSAQDYKLYLERLNVFPKSMHSALQSLREGVRTGIMPHKNCLGGALERIDRMADSRTDELKLYAPFLSIPSHIQEADDLRRDAQELFRDRIIPTLRDYRDFIHSEYLPNLRPSISISTLPGPDGRYAAMLRFYCDDDVSPQQIHEMGLQEMQQVTAKIDKIKEKLEFEGSLRDLAGSLHDREEFQFKNCEEVVKYCESFYRDKILPRVGEFFKYKADHPLTFTVAYEAPPSKAEYNAPAQDGSHAAGLRFSPSFHADFLSYDVPTLMLHEAEPGHHLQACYAMRNHDLPMFRRVKDDRHYVPVPGRFPLNSSYTEGWGLYCEHLGDEWGIFDDPFSMFGFLAAQLDRSCRMVVDTGIHAFNWSRERCVEFMLRNTCMTRPAIEGEIDRYTYVPGQACCYSYGCMKFMHLRQKAREALGDKFDIKEFHDAVLSCGQVPLNILDAVVTQYIDGNLQCTDQS